jgi:hypothetical protein
MIRVRTTPARLDTATFRLSHWFVLSRILLLIRLGLRIVHCQWGVQSVSESSEYLYEYITLIAGCFTDSDSTLFRSKVVTCLETMLTPDVGGAAFHLALEEVKTFFWQKYVLSQLVLDLELWNWHKQFNVLQQGLERCRSFEDTDIIWMMEGLLEDPELGDPELDDPESP